MSIQLNPLADYLVENIYNDSAPYVRSQYKKLIAERDTSDVWRQFAIWLLVDPDHGVIRFSKPDSKQYQAIQDVADLYDENCKDRELWEYNADAAWSAYYAAYYATADTAWSAYAAAKAADAAYHAAADAARDDANAGAWSAAEAAARSAAAAAAHVAAHNRMAEKLLELLQLAPHLDTTR